MSAAAVTGIGGSQLRTPGGYERLDDPGRRLRSHPARTRRKAARHRRHTRFGVPYETWYAPGYWATARAEATPLLGHYRSDDPKVIRQHARWLTYAGIDHVMVDWTNTLSEDADLAAFTIRATDKLVEEYAKLAHRPEIVLLLSGYLAGTDSFIAQVERIKHRYLDRPSYRDLFVTHDGKPLLTLYAFPSGASVPDWDDSAFTIRWVGGAREIMLAPLGQWSWTDRLPFANGALTKVSSFADDGLANWQADPAWHVGTIRSDPAYAQHVDLVAANTQPAAGRTQQHGTITSRPFTITERVLTFNAIGVDYYSARDLDDLDKRNVFVLEDADSGATLRYAVPPGDPVSFHVRQWNVAELIGRRVVFRAVCNSTWPPVGWLGFDGIYQQRCEQMVPNVAIGGNELQSGGYTAWDAHLRNSGGYLLEMFRGVYHYEPEFALIQQWNEFTAPDMFSVMGSNDIEPTRVHQLAGDDSDGWGYYYLNLVRDLVDDYRAGAEFPAVMLDSRYP